MAEEDGLAHESSTDGDLVWRIKSEYAILRYMSLRSCLVSCRDLQGIEHIVTVTAESLYEAVALGLRIFRENAWVDEIGRGLTAIQVVVKQPEVQHTVLVKDFEHWLASTGNTPAEV